MTAVPPAHCESVAGAARGANFGARRESAGVHGEVLVPEPPEGDLEIAVGVFQRSDLSESH